MIAIYQALHIIVSGGPYESDLSGLNRGLPGLQMTVIVFFIFCIVYTHSIYFYVI